MTRDDVIKYLVPALLCIFEEDYYGDAIELEKLLGKTEYQIWRKKGYVNNTPIAEDYKNILIALAGPHGKTLYKVLVARKESETCTSS